MGFVLTERTAHPGRDAAAPPVPVMSSTSDPVVSVADATSTRRKLLASSQLFRSLPLEALDEVLDRLEPVHLPGGGTLFRQGEEGDAMYLIAAGRVEVIVETDGEREVVREMGRGENLGELSLLTDEPRAATIRAIRDAELLRLSRDAFESLLADQPAAALQLTRILARWVRESNRPPPRRGIGTVAVLPETEGAPHIDFARALARALEEHGSTLLLDASCVDRQLGDGAAEADEGTREHRAVTEWLNSREQSHRFLVYCGGEESTAWSRRCARQADIILRVARPGGRVIAPADPGQGTDPDDPSRQETLVLLHSPGAVPTEAGYWLEGGRYPRHFHVREDRPADTARVARHLAGRALGVVLGGGGALGFAHVGVLKALAEAGVTPDRFGGTSMGSIVAALFAAGHSADEAEERLHAAWGRMSYRPHRASPVPIYALDSGERVRSTFEWTFGDRRIEDLWYPFFCTTTNLTTGRLVVHRSGSVARWLDASVAIPGIVPPSVSDDGELMADGALLNNLPSDIMVRDAQGPVVAIGVATEQEPRVDREQRHAPSGWEAVVGKVLPFRTPPEFPNIVQTLHRSAVIGSVHARRDVESEVDLYLKPRLTGFDMFSWSALSDVVEAGYRHTVDRLEAEPDLLDPLDDPTRTEEAIR